MRRRAGLCGRYLGRGASYSGIMSRARSSGSHLDDGQNVSAGVTPLIPWWDFCRCRPEPGTMSRRQLERDRSQSGASEAAVSSCARCMTSAGVEVRASKL